MDKLQMDNEILISNNEQHELKAQNLHKIPLWRAKFHNTQHTPEAARNEEVTELADHRMLSHDYGYTGYWIMYLKILTLLFVCNQQAHSHSSCFLWAAENMFSSYSN